MLACLVAWLDKVIFPMIHIPTDDLAQHRCNNNNIYLLHTYRGRVPATYDRLPGSSDQLASALDNVPLPTLRTVV